MTFRIPLRRSPVTLSGAPAHFPFRRRSGATPLSRFAAQGADRPRAGGLPTAGALLTLLTLLVATPAHAFVQTQTCGDGPNAPIPCQGNERPLPVYWDRGCIPYHVNPAGSAIEGRTDAQVREAIEASFEAWSAPECTYLHLYRAGDTNEDRVGYNSCRGASGNANVVLFRAADWPWAISAVALTSVTYRVSTGEILDADIELNFAEFPFGIIDNPAVERGTVDLANALTHEVGHLIGLDHTTPESMREGEPAEFNQTVMFERTVAGEIRKRTLHPNDELAVCSIYPADLDPHDEDCAEAPRFFHSRPDAAMDETCRRRRGCSAAPATPSPLPTAGTLLLLGGLLALRRREGLGT